MKEFTSVVQIAVTHDKPIKDLSDLIAGRVYTLQGVTNTEARVLSAAELTYKVPHELISHCGAWRKAIQACIIISSKGTLVDPTDLEVAEIWREELKAFDEAFAKLVSNTEVQR